jgi:hypothetical protein
MGVAGLSEGGIFGVAEELTLPLRARNDHAPNDVYRGHVTLPNGQRRTKAFVKVFPPDQRNQLVYNEVVAHLLAVQCGLPSPLTARDSGSVEGITKDIGLDRGDGDPDYSGRSCRLICYWPDRRPSIDVGYPG